MITSWDDRLKLREQFKLKYPDINKIPLSEIHRLVYLLQKNFESFVGIT